MDAPACTANRQRTIEKPPEPMVAANCAASGAFTAVCSTDGIEPAATVAGATAFTAAPAAGAFTAAGFSAYAKLFVEAS